MAKLQIGCRLGRIPSLRVRLRRKSNDPDMDPDGSKKNAIEANMRDPDQPSGSRHADRRTDRPGRPRSDRNQSNASNASSNRHQIRRTAAVSQRSSADAPSARHSDNTSHRRRRNNDSTNMWGIMGGSQNNEAARDAPQDSRTSRTGNSSSAPSTQTSRHPTPPLSSARASRTRDSRSRPQTSGASSMQHRSQTLPSSLSRRRAEARQAHTQSRPRKKAKMVWQVGGTRPKSPAGGSKSDSDDSSSSSSSSESQNSSDDALNNATPSTESSYVSSSEENSSPARPKPPHHAASQTRRPATDSRGPRIARRSHVARIPRPQPSRHVQRSRITITQTSARRRETRRDAGRATRRRASPHSSSSSEDDSESSSSSASSSDNISIASSGSHRRRRSASRLETTTNNSNSDPSTAETSSDMVTSSESESESSNSSTHDTPQRRAFSQPSRQRQGTTVAGMLSDIFAASEIFSSRADEDSEDDSVVLDPDQTLGDTRLLHSGNESDDSSFTTVYLNSDEEDPQLPKGLKDNQIKRLPIILYAPPSKTAPGAAVATKKAGKRSHREAKGTKGKSSPKASSEESAEAVDPDRIACSICMSDYVDGDPLRLLVCFHRFHKDCIDPWLSQTPQCPICRTQIEIPET